MTRELAPGPHPEPNHPAWQMVNFFPATEFGEQAWAAFQCDLPRLLEAHRGEWAVYHGARLLAVGSSHLRLYEQFLQQGFSPDELVICHIEPVDGGAEMIGGASWADQSD